MGKTAKRSFQPFPASQEVIEADKFHQQSSWKITEKVGGGGGGGLISCDFTFLDSTKNGSDSSNSMSSSTSSDLMEDASSFSSSSSSSSSSNGPLYQLSDLMAQLPIKRGLSKYYQGKSQSFKSLASVESLEDLGKRENPYRKRIKFCGVFDDQRFCSPKATISKKASSRGSLSSKSLWTNISSSNYLMVSCRPTPVPVIKDF